MDPEASRQQLERQAALDYHAHPRPGKLEIRPTKPMATARDLSRAYSPGVAEACLEIAADPALATRYTAKRNLVAVISNGTAVLGLGNIGAQAAKPVMEGKAVLFKKFAGIDCFDIEVDEPDPEALADLVCRLEPTFGAINLEDIKAPDCFTVERICRDRMGIPVFHDDQHGTAIVVAAAVQNALRLAGKRAQDIRIVGLGAGAAGVACLTMLHKMGVPLDNITVFDRSGVLHAGRTGLAPEQMIFATAPAGLTLEQALKGADMFLG
ncbi:MAG TPA: NADP-dependent malic enzyme, partial [Citreicella sp.]|nr:NADP-dependent malic enzyme [Citreicella sp.]